MKILFKNPRLCEDVLTKPEKFAAHENVSHDAESFRIIEIKTLPNGHVSAQAVIVQKTLDA